MEFEINSLVLQSRTENLETVREKIKKLIEDSGGTVTDKLEYRKRKLSYKIKHELYGFFTVFRFTVEDYASIGALKKNLNLYQDVARYIIVRSDKLPALKEETVPAEQERRQMEEKDTIKQEEVEKIISGKRLSEKKKQNPARQEEKARKEEAEEPKREAGTRTVETEEKTREKEKRENEKDENEDDRSSLEDLDKKLDEILNI